MDILYDCAEAYKQLLNNEYHIKFFVDEEIKELILAFSEKEFKHLTGLEKLKDKNILHDLSSSTLFNYILDHKIVYDKSSYANSQNIEEQIVDSKHINDPINNIDKSNVAYNVVDRIAELTNLTLNCIMQQISLCLLSSGYLMFHLIKDQTIQI